METKIATILEQSVSMVRLNHRGNNFHQLCICYQIIPNKCTLCKGNGLEIHNVETALILSVFKAKLYHY